MLDYIVSVLRNQYMPVDNFNEILEHLMTKGETPTNVELLLSRLESRLEDLGISVKPRPQHTRALGVDEQNLPRCCGRRLNPREPAVQHDVDSIAAVHRLRRGQKAVDIENCRAMFVTTSYRLCETSARFFSEHFGRTTAPHCMSSQAFTTIVWLKFPAQAPELPMKRLVADCYAALSPSPSLWSRFVAELSDLRAAEKLSLDDFYYLRFSVPARNALVEITGGNPTAFDAETIPEVLERARAQARAEVEAHLEAERISRRLVEAELLKEKEASSQLSSDAQSAQQNAARLSQVVEETRSALLASHNDVMRRLSRVGEWAGRLAAAAVLSGLVVAIGGLFWASLLFSFFPGLKEQSAWAWAVMVIAALAVACLSILNLRSALPLTACTLVRQLFRQDH